MKLLALFLLTLSVSPETVCEGQPAGAPCVVTLSDGDHSGVCMGAPPSCMPVPPAVPAQ